MMSGTTNGTIKFICTEGAVSRSAGREGQGVGTEAPGPCMERRGRWTTTRLRKDVLMMMLVFCKMDKNLFQG